VDLTSSPDPFDAQTLRNPGGFHPGGPVVLMDEDGKILERSVVSIHVFDFLSLAPDEMSFAFLGAHLDRPQDGVGVFVAGFRGEEVRKLAAVQTVSYEVQWRSSLDWSTDGRSLLFSGAEGIQVINVRTGESQKIADGGFARWSPSGEWITYTTLRNEAVLFNLATREAKPIDPGHEVIAPIEWSPDGKYLLLREGEGSHVPYGCYWVYRISDSAWLPLQDLGVGGGRPNWMR
jgi:WD40 repeat protein